MKISVRMNGFFNRISINKTFNVKLKESDTLEKLLKKIEKKVKINILKVFIESLGNPVLLLNGNRIDLQEKFSIKLKDGDEITILQALSGG